eukprot:893358-Alexandrium_andersonii.AAC.1
MGSTDLEGLATGAPALPEERSPQLYSARPSPSRARASVPDCLGTNGLLRVAWGRWGSPRTSGLEGKAM